MENQEYLDLIDYQIITQENHKYLLKKAKDSRELGQAFLKVADDIRTLASSGGQWALAQEYLIMEAQDRSKNFFRLGDLLEQKAFKILNPEPKNSGG